MNGKNKKVFWIVLAVIALGLVCYVENFLHPTYVFKSAVKILCFAGTILLYSFCTHRNVKDTIYLHKITKNMKPLLYSVLFCFAGIGAAFLLFRSQIDLQAIRTSLMTKENLTKENCLFVFAYIILVNSFLEEAFFRGFITNLFENRRIGAVISAVLFSLYHVGIVVTWFNPFVFAVCILGLAAVGLFMQWLCDSHGSIAASWFAHASANIAINVIGALLIFEILK